MFNYINSDDEEVKINLKEKCTYVITLIITLQLLFSAMVISYSYHRINNWNGYLTMAYYPTPKNSITFNIIIYIHEIIILTHSAILLNIEIFIIMLLHLSKIQLKILNNHIINAIEFDDLIQCISKHNKILR